MLYGALSGFFIHEFLHSIDSFSNALRLPVPLDDGERFGYPERDECRPFGIAIIHIRIVRDGKRYGVEARILEASSDAFSLTTF